MSASKKRRIVSLNSLDLEKSLDRLKRLRKTFTSDDGLDDSDTLPEKVDNLIALLESQIEDQHCFPFSAVDDEALEGQNIRLAGLLLLQPPEKLHDAIESTRPLGAAELWSNENFYRHLSFLSNTYSNVDASSRMFIDAFFFRAAAMVPPDQRMLLMLDKPIPSAHSGERNPDTISGMIDYTALVADTRVARTHHRRPPPLTQHLSQNTTVFFVKKVSASEGIPIIEYTPQAVIEIIACAKHLGRSHVRGALTTGDKWIFLAVNLDGVGEGATYWESETVEWRRKRAGMDFTVSMTSEEDDPALITGILSSWVLNSFSEFDGDQWFSSPLLRDTTNSRGSPKDLEVDQNQALEDEKRFDPDLDFHLAVALGDKVASRDLHKKNRNCDDMEPNVVALLDPAKYLPEEILHEIFLHNATDSRVYVGDRATTTLRSSQVCRSWREASLRCIHLWSTIIDYERDSPVWMETLLKRSFPAPLNICGDFEDPVSWLSRSHPEDLDAHHRGDLLLAHKERWHALCVYGLLETEFHPLVRLIDDYLLQPAPYIRALKLGKIWSYCHLKGALFTGHAPSLRSLDLTDIKIDFHALRGIGGRLEEFSVSWDDHNFIQDHQLLLEWMNFLRATPQLRYLFFHHNVADVADQIRQEFDSGRIVLHKLQTICLEIPDVTVCKAIVDNLAIPDMCGVMIYCVHPQSSNDLLLTQELIRSRVQYWTQSCNSKPPKDNRPRALYAHAAAGKPYRSLSNFELSSDGLGTYKKEFDAIVKGHICPADPPIAFQTGTGTHSHWQLGPRYQFLSQLLAFDTSFSTTTRLRLSIGQYDPLNNVENSMLQEMLAQLVNLTSLEVPNAFCDTLLLNLSQPVAPGNGTISGSDAASVRLPELRYIQFFPEVPTRVIYKQVLVRIRKCLQLRARRGYPVEVINLTGSLEKGIVDTVEFSDLEGVARILH